MQGSFFETKIKSAKSNKPKGDNGWDDFVPRDKKRNKTAKDSYSKVREHKRNYEGE